MATEANLKREYEEIGRRRTRRWWWFAPIFVPIRNYQDGKRQKEILKELGN